MTIQRDHDGARFDAARAFLGSVNVEENGKTFGVYGNVIVEVPAETLTMRPFAILVADLSNGMRMYSKDRMLPGVVYQIWHADLVGTNADDLEARMQELFGNVVEYNRFVGEHSPAVLAYSARIVQDGPNLPHMSNHTVAHQESQLGPTRHQRRRSAALARSGN